MKRYIITSVTNNLIRNTKCDELGKNIRKWCLWIVPETKIDDLFNSIKILVEEADKRYPRTKPLSVYKSSMPSMFCIYISSEEKQLTITMHEIAGELSE